MLLKKGITVLILLCCMRQGSSQVVYERHTSEVYAFLSRLAQKGVLEWDDLIRPISKVRIKEGLDSVQAHEQQLTGTEKKELAFLAPLIPSSFILRVTAYPQYAYSLAILLPSS